MVRRNTTEEPDTNDVGWRLKQLRLRRCLRQNEVAELASLDPGYLNRLENGATRKARPKPDTVHRILDALGASADERAAVFHIETPPISPLEVERVVREVEELEEENFLPVTLLDHHWFRWYHNRSMRAVLAFSPEEYRRSVGELPLHSLVDPGSPTFKRFPEEERLNSFAQRAFVFQRQFAQQEFDSWYLNIVAQLRQFPGIGEIWDDPKPMMSQKFLDSYSSNLFSPTLGKTLNFRSQLNRLLRDPRFTVVHLTPEDDETASMVKELRQNPRYSFGHFDAVKSVGIQEQE
ncbi:MAG TPA: helix-turn-helix transcriptional regulator [Chloroflexia bacterium]|nr:helix-turn-helix transcriptional regulator [Chloroflexia bacterium]